MPTKEHRRHARNIVEALETRAHAGPTVCATEIVSARTFLEQHDFSPSSDYFSRLSRLQDCARSRPPVRQEKRNYGGEAAGCWMQVQSIYDHVILSVCYHGEFNSRRGRVKLSHRFNAAGRIDFVELKFLRSLQPELTGEIRKLLLVKDYAHVRKDWLATEVHVLRVLPQELIFLFNDLFRCPRGELLAWLVNIGHRTIADLLGDLRITRFGSPSAPTEAQPNQLPLTALVRDEVALPILQQAAELEAFVEAAGAESAVLRYITR